MTTKGKDIRPKETPNRDPDLEGYNYDEFFSNRLSLPKTVKDSLAAEGLDWRFINATEFRKDGNTHKSHWKPKKFTDGPGKELANAEGYITRGDLILGVRPKDVSSAHRKFLNKRNNIQKDFNKVEGQKMRRAFKDAGLEQESKVYEGYED